MHDSGTASRWGSISWRVDLPAGCTLAFRTRSGNSAKPDRTWSEWSEPLTDPTGSRISSPNARFIEWKAEMTGTNGATPLLNSVTLAYLPQNSPPVIQSINVITQAVPSSQAARTATAASIRRLQRDRHAIPETPARLPPPAPPRRPLPRASTQQITVTWQAEDPDGDRLVYAVYFRGEDETQWKLLKSASHDNTLTFDADVLADGKYYFRVTASDRESNPPSSARDAQLVSAPVMIDNTPPTIALGAARYSAGAAHIEWQASDAASPLRHCEYSLDAAGLGPRGSGRRRHRFAP